jgi:hypothetical protein
MRVELLVINFNMSEISIIAIIASAVIVTVIGFIWYHPKVFGAAWMRMVGVTPEAAEQGKKRMPIVVGVAILASMLLAYVMNVFGASWGVTDVGGAVVFGFWCWAGFVAPVLLGIVLWEQKPITLYFINAAYWLVAFVAIAITLVIL